MAKTDAPAADFSGLNSITQKGDEKEKGKAKQSPPQVSDSSEESDSGDKTKGKAKGKGKAKQSSLKDFKYGRQEKPKTSSKRRRLASYLIPCIRASLVTQILTFSLRHSLEDFPHHRRAL